MLNIKILCPIFFCCVVLFCFFFSNNLFVLFYAKFVMICYFLFFCFVNYIFWNIFSIYLNKLIFSSLYMMAKIDCAKLEISTDAQCTCYLHDFEIQWSAQNILIQYRVFHNSNRLAPNWFSIRITYNYYTSYIQSYILQICSIQQFQCTFINKISIGKIICFNISYKIVFLSYYFIHI